MCQPVALPSALKEHAKEVLYKIFLTSYLSLLDQVSKAAC